MSSFQIHAWFPLPGDKAKKGSMPSFCPALVPGHYPKIGAKITSLELKLKKLLDFNYITNRLLTFRAPFSRVEAGKYILWCFFPVKAWCCCLAILTARILSESFMRPGVRIHFQYRTEIKNVLFNGPSLLICSLFIHMKAGHNWRVFFNELDFFYLSLLYPEDIQHFNRWHCKFFLMAHFKHIPLHHAHSHDYSNHHISVMYLGYI